MRIGLLIFPMLEELDLVGPWEMVSMWSQQPGGPEDRLLVAQSLEPVVCAKGLSLNPHITFEACPALDVLVVPGGQGTRTEVDNPVLVDFIRRQAPGCQAILSVCTGAFLLHRASLLSGKRATTHWASLDRLRTLSAQLHLTLDCRHPSPRQPLLARANTLNEFVRYVFTRLAIYCF